MLHHDVCRIVTFGTLWRLSHYDVCRIMTFGAYDVCRLWPLSPYDVCCIMTFVVYDDCRIMMFVALWRLSLIMTFVAYRVCRSISNTRGGFPKISALLWARGQDAFLVIRGMRDPSGPTAMFAYKVDLSSFTFGDPDVIWTHSIIPTWCEWKHYGVCLAQKQVKTPLPSGEPAFTVA